MSSTKLIIIEGGDRTGKDSLIKNLCKYYDYKNIAVRHFDKPPKELTAEETLDFQFKCFVQEFELVSFMQHMNEKFSYHKNIMVWNRSHLGEYVYASMFRNADTKKLKHKIFKLENYYINTIFKGEIYLITLTSDPKFFFSKEDGKSFSKTLDDKTKELELFKEAHEFSIIKNKLLLKVDENGEFRCKEDIFEQVLNFLKNVTKEYGYSSFKNI